MSLNRYYKHDLEYGLKILHELNTHVMSPKRRKTLETCLEAILICLDLYEHDNR